MVDDDYMGHGPTLWGHIIVGHLIGLVVAVGIAIGLDWMLR